MHINKLLISVSLLVSFAFLVIGIATISHYGMNWDEPIHFRRGQAYLHFFASGGEKTENLGLYKRLSFYHEEGRQAVNYLKNDCCHPPFNGILFSVSNYLFFEKLGILPDIEAYNIMGVFLSSILLFIFVLFIGSELGLIVSIFAGLSLFLYPLFLAETHFNVKDPPETVFFTITLILLYLAVKKLSWRTGLLAGLFFGFTWGTKFNAVFLPFIFIPWLFIYYLYNRRKPVFRIISTKLFLFFLFPVVGIIGFLFFFSSWPYLWQNPVKHLLEVFSWYKLMGMENNYQPSFLLFGFNTYPFLWIFFTTPLIIIFLAIAGIIKCFISIYKKEKNSLIYLLILFWFIIPILRVSLPDTSIYGGVRHIMEFIPPLAMLAGIGSQTLVRWRKERKVKVFIIAVICIAFVFHVGKLWMIHPNETVYFNEFAGGLKGAYSRDIPSAGFDVGNLYKQGVNWLNINAEKGAKLTLVNHGDSAIPKTFFRKDILFSDKFWSGEEQKGEYIIGLIYSDWNSDFYYKSAYLQRFLKPLYEIKIDNVSVLNIWKNSPEFVYPQYKKREKLEVILNGGSGELMIKLPKKVKLTKMEIYFDNNNCSPLKLGELFTSLDGLSWRSSYRQLLNEEDSSKAFILEKEKLIRFFPGDVAKYVLLTSDPENSCLTTRAKKGIFWYIP